MSGTTDAPEQRSMSKFRKDRAVDRKVYGSALTGRSSADSSSISSGKTQDCEKIEPRSVKAIVPDNVSDEESNDKNAGYDAAKRRHGKKDLRQKRRPTGVVLLPKGGDEEEEISNSTEKSVLDESQGSCSGISSSEAVTSPVTTDQLVEQILAYQQAVDEWKNECEKIQQELASLKLENDRLRDENNTLRRRLVGQGTRGR